MNTVAKGTRNEKKCEDFFIELGYITWRTFRTKYRDLDMFKLFDVVALHPDGHKMLFIQVKSNKCDRKTKETIRAFKMPEGCEKWVWIWIDRKGWYMEELNGD